VSQAARVHEIPGLIDVDSPPLLLAGEMPARINRELRSGGMREIPDLPGMEPVFARMIFASLAARYAHVVADLAIHTQRTFARIAILGGGSRNALLSRLTEEATGLPVVTGEAEGSTIGNFAVQLAAGEAAFQPPLSASAVRSWAARLCTSDSTAPHP
jgi:rhamnulokinase